MPPGHDLMACQIFFSILRSAQDRQLPADRRRKLTGRQELSDPFIMELNRRILEPPATEPKPFWIPEKKSETQLEIIKREIAPPVPVPAVAEQRPPEPIHVAEIPAKTETPHSVLVSVSPTSLRSFSDDEIFAETHRRFAMTLGLSAKVEALEKRIPTVEQLSLLTELAEMQKLIVEETGALAKNQEALIHRLDSFEAELRKVNTAVGEAPTANLIPRVAILGCRRYEMEHIRQGCEEVGLKLDFRHYDQDENPRKIHAEYAISLKWLNHSWDGQIKDAIANGKYVFLNGGVGMAVNQLKTWFQSA